MSHNSALVELDPLLNTHELFQGIPEPVPAVVGGNGLPTMGASTEHALPAHTVDGVVGPHPVPQYPGNGTSASEQGPATAATPAAERRATRRWAEICGRLGKMVGRAVEVTGGFIERKLDEWDGRGLQRVRWGNDVVDYVHGGEPFTMPVSPATYNELIGTGTAAQNAHGTPVRPAGNTLGDLLRYDEAVGWEDAMRRSQQPDNSAHRSDFDRAA